MQERVAREAHRREEQGWLAREHAAEEARAPEEPAVLAGSRKRTEKIADISAAIQPNSRLNMPQKRPRGVEVKCGPLKGEHRPGSRRFEHTVCEDQSDETALKRRRLAAIRERPYRHETRIGLASPRKTQESDGLPKPTRVTKMRPNIEDTPFSRHGPPGLP